MAAQDPGPLAPASASPDQRLAQFRALYDLSLPRVYAFVSRALAPEVADVDDLVAEIYLVTWRRIDRLPPPPADQLWLFGVARNVIAHDRRSRARRANLLARLFRERPNDVQDDTGHRDVLDAIRGLPRREQDAIHLLIWEGLTHEEAAEVLGCSANAVRIRLHRARRRLARRLGVDEQPADRQLPAATLDLELPK